MEGSSVREDSIIKKNAHINCLSVQSLILACLTICLSEGWHMTIQLNLTISLTYHDVKRRIAITFNLKIEEIGF